MSSQVAENIPEFQEFPDLIKDLVKSTYNVTLSFRKRKHQVIKERSTVTDHR